MAVDVELDDEPVDELDDDELDPTLPAVTVTSAAAVGSPTTKLSGTGGFPWAASRSARVRAVTGGMLATLPPSCAEEKAPWAPWYAPSRVVSMVVSAASVVVWSVAAGTSCG